MRAIAVLIVALGLAACGVDGEPIQPSAQTNVNITSSGVSLGTNLRVGQGPFSVNLGLGL